MGCRVFNIGSYFLSEESRMDIQQTLSELTALPVPDRLHVLETLWDSIDAETPVELSPAEQSEINRRLDAHEANPDELLTWDQVLDQLREKL